MATDTTDGSDHEGHHVVKRGKPLKRTGELARKTPLARKSKTNSGRSKTSTMRCTFETPRRDRPSSRCTKRGYVVVSDVERYCKGHATQVADQMVGDAVKERDRFECQFAKHRWNNQPCTAGVLSACHLIGKGAYPATRWETDNIVAGCPGHHMSFDNYDLGADVTKYEWAELRVGTLRWEQLRQQARSQKGEKAVDVIRRYREAA